MSQSEERSLKQWLGGVAGAMVLLFVVQTGSLIWWASSVTTTNRFIMESVAELKQAIAKINARGDKDALQDQRVTWLETALADIQKRLSDLEHDGTSHGAGRTGVK